jgi:Family of unknown function (DUF5691)
MSQSWETLVSVALLGTDRQKTLPAIAEETIKPLMDRVDSSDAEHWLLSAAGTLAAYQQAGQKSEKRTERLPEPAEAEALKPEEPAFLPFLRMIFTQGFQPALPEFLSLLQQSGQCIPPEFLPQLLDWGHFHPEVRSQLKPVIGARGEWLARLNTNPKWRYAQATPQSSNPEEWKELWETSDRTVRLVLLREWRSQGSSAARELVETTWKQDAAKDRAAFLECFSIGLTLADEAFLEKGLGDRSKEVRAVAVDLLSKQPETRFSQQMALLVKKYVQIVDVKGKLQIKIALPDPKDSQWQQAGLDAYRAFQDMISGGLIIQEMFTKQGDRASLLMQIVALAPLSVWADTGTPEAILTASTQHEWENILMHGWLLATHRQQNNEWSWALLNWSSQNFTKKGQWHLPWQTLGQLLSKFSQQQQEDWIRSWLSPEVWAGEQLELLSCLTYRWSLLLSQRILETAQQFLNTSQTQSKKTQHQAIWSVFPLKSMAFGLHPDVLSQASNTSPEEIYSHLHIPELERIWEVLKFRQQMYQGMVVKEDPSG